MSKSHSYQVMELNGDGSRASSAKSLLPETNKNGKFLIFLQAFTRIGVPLIFLTFCVCFSITGALIIASYPED